VASALIQPKMLEWARKRAGFAIEDVAKKLSVKDAAQILAWEQKAQPLFRRKKPPGFYMFRLAICF